MLGKVVKACSDATLVCPTACHAEADGISPYASLAIAKGNVTRDITRWLVIEQEFGRSPKTAPYGVPAFRQLSFLPVANRKGYPERISDEMNEFHYSMIIQWSDEDNKFIVTIPEFVGAVTHGGTYEEAVKNGKEVIELCIKTEQALGDPLPQPRTYAS